ncbi:relaxase/mobilization nuclease domain-containing protein [Anaeromicropila herbilytica]|uniref:Mobilisation protein n=1 Tax=Anaeromicropila herbilytica TaxID=2785025 RepID=A0A7R7EJD2_9FIRM|nr:relaxase/mobilization nuclease domain-containing protein [Anaeromicropila herbilytica]BCN29522.1 mobilisation protein [Anaeromicropila herbilytica]
MAIIEFINGKKNTEGKRTTYKSLGSMKRLINYILKPEKTNEWLKGGIGCNPDTAYEEFILTKALYNKLPSTTTERSKSDQLIHFTQSFKKEEVSPELCKEIADELLNHELFQGYQVVYATHIDREHLHTHFVINSVNMDDGIRWHISANDLQRLKDYSDELCREHGLSIIPKKDKNQRRENTRLHQHTSSGEYRAKKQGRSWKAETLHAGLAVRKVALNREEFISMMNGLGYKVRWEDTRKDITFTTPEGKKINSDKLGFPERNYTPLTKESLEKQFALNRQVKENNNESIIRAQEKSKLEILKIIDSLTRDNDTNQYPFQNNWNNGHLEGQALKDKLIELEKGKGIDWERE